MEHKILEQQGYTNYTCNKCKNNLDLIEINTTNTSDTIQKKCFNREGNLSYCLKGKIEEKGNYICTQCIENAYLNTTYNLC